MTFREIQKILKKDGWYYYDTVGSHIQYKHPIKSRKGNFSKTLQDALLAKVIIKNK